MCIHITIYLYIAICIHTYMYMFTYHIISVLPVAGLPAGPVRREAEVNQREDLIT